MSNLAVTNGHILALRLFDIAYAIDLIKAESLWARHAAGRTSRPRLTATPPKAMAFGVPPLAVMLDPVSLMLETGTVEAVVTARLYDFGAVSLSLRVATPNCDWHDYTKLLNAVDRCVGPKSGTGSETGSDTVIWERLLAHLRSVLAAALIKPARSSVSEDYLMGVVHNFDSHFTGAELLQRVDLVPLLSGETRPLSDGAKTDLLRQRFSYYADDLVVLTWDRAFIYEPRGDSDVADVLEVANAQLLEMRYYDELLDDELPRMYDLVEATRSRWNVLAARRYAELARTLTTLVAEVTELTEKVDNALQVTEDVYLARIYASALDLYRVPTVNRAVQRKLSIIRDTYTALYDEASSSRSQMMEAAILLLIFVELVLALLRH
jgi:hypothetical protein